MIYKTDMKKISEFAEQYRQNKAAMENRQNQISDIQWYEWKERNSGRILPPWSPEGIIARVIYKHYNLPPERKHYVCLRTTWSEQCYICTAIARVWKINSKIQLNIRGKAYANWIDRDNEDIGPQVIYLPMGIWNWILVQMNDPVFGDIADVKSGADLRITRRIVGDRPQDVEYSANIINQNTPLSKDSAKVDLWLASMKNLDQIFKKPTSKSIQDNIDAARKFLRDMGLDPSIGPEHLLPDDRYVILRTTSPEDAGYNGKDLQESADKEKNKNPAPQSPGDVANSARSGRPDCFGIGYDPGKKKCMICIYETSCMDASV